jgi:hypothetical protein
MPQKKKQDIEVLVPLEVISKFDHLFLLCGVNLYAHFHFFFSFSCISLDLFFNEGCT